MIEIIPAVMPKNYDDLADKAGLFAGVVPIIQLDIMDGKFVPDRTWPYFPGDTHFKSIVQEEEGMPEWNNLDFEIDLMVEKPEDQIEKWIMTGAQRIIVHVESMTDFMRIRNMVPIGMIELGLAVNTTTELKKIDPYLDRIDFVQCMGIEKIGFQGQPFDERVLEHVRTLRAMSSDIPISIDGAVNVKTASALVKAGATRLVAGSAILKSGDVSLAILELKNLVQ